MDLREAVTDILKEKQWPVITEYELSLLLVRLYNAGQHKGMPLRIKKNVPNSRDISAAISRLYPRTLQSDDDFGLGSGVYRVLVASDQPAEEICCIIDPFCYVSHLSAMQRHGLTNRIPVELSITTPGRKIWISLKEQKESDDYSALSHIRERTTLRQITLPEIIRNRKVIRHESVLAGGWQEIRESNIRISTIGRTFMDMLIRPNWCGGISHVLEVWEASASEFLDEIIEAVDGAPKKLIRVRAGYILDEMLNIKDARIEKWVADAQRGGSQVLNPDKPYTEPYSEKWMLSINV